VANQIETIHAQVGLRMRAMREALGLDQSEVGRRLGLDRTSITNIETGRQRLQLHTVEKIAAAFGTTAKHVMKGIWW